MSCIKKTCFKCGRSLCLTEFARNKSTTDGLQHWCRQCMSLAVMKCRQSEKGREACRRAYRKYTHSDQGKRYRVSAAKRYSERNPEKYRARYTAHSAVRSGKLVRPTQCSSCGKKCKPEMHHMDYSKPLEIIWLCRGCHEGIRERS